MVCKKNAVSCAIIGDGMVGKTCMTKRFTGNQFSTEYIATVTEMSNGTVSAYGDKYSVSIQEHEDQSSRSDAIQNAEIIIVCYSSVDRESFESIKSYWIPEIRKQSKKIPIVLVATQSDIRDENDKGHISDTEGQNLMKEINADFYNKCSAATGEGIKNVFESIVCSYIRYKKKKSNILKRVFAR